MELKFNEITEADYNSLDAKELIKADSLIQYNHFIEIVVCQQSVKLCWQSDSVFPDIYNIDDHIFFIGIDLDFLIFDFFDSKTKLSVKLDNYYIEHHLFNEILLVITELDIYMINTQSIVIDSVIHLPDAFSHIKFDNDNARVSCMDGSEIDIRLSEQTK